MAAESCGPLVDAARCQERILVSVDRVGFDLDDVRSSQAEYPLESVRRIQRWQREQKVRRAMAPQQHAIDHATICSVHYALLARLKREVPSHERSPRQKALREDVRAEVHMMVTIDARGIGAVETAKLVNLCRDDILE